MGYITLAYKLYFTSTSSVLLMLRTLVDTSSIVDCQRSNDNEVAKNSQLSVKIVRFSDKFLSCVSERSWIS